MGMADLPVCPRPGHGETRVIRDGVQRRGGRERQRYRCVLPDGSYHRFVGALSRTHIAAGVCDHCDNRLRPDEGPVAPPGFDYLVREIAGALVAIGKGESYTDAARRVRASAYPHRIGRRAPGTVESGQSVAEWLADFGPVVAAPFLETEWPETIVCDSTEFMYTDPRTGVTSQLFAVLAAWG